MDEGAAQLRWRGSGAAGLTWRWNGRSWQSRAPARSTHRQRSRCTWRRRAGAWREVATRCKRGEEAVNARRGTCAASSQEVEQGNSSSQARLQGPGVHGRSTRCSRDLTTPRLLDPTRWRLEGVGEERIWRAGLPFRRGLGAAGAPRWSGSGAVPPEEAVREGGGRRRTWATAMWGSGRVGNGRVQRRSGRIRPWGCWNGSGTA